MKILCNPLNIEYKFQHVKSGYAAFRECADPTAILFKGKYYIFPSMSAGFWYSDDLIHWDFHENRNLPVCDYAPDVRQIGEYMYFCASRIHEPSTFYRTKDPFEEKYEVVSSPFPFWDPHMFQDDDGRVYFYWGCSNKEPIRGVEMDPETMLPISEPVNLVSGHPEIHGYERIIRNGKPVPDGLPFIEGAYLNKYQGKYYLQYSNPGTEFNTYCDGVYVSDKPLGPYVPQESNPFSLKPGGFICGSGHGSTFKDKYGNWWYTGTMTISMHHLFERRIGLFPAGFDVDGIMFCNQSFADYPLEIPEGRFDPLSIEPRWMLLSYKKPVVSSSYVGGHPASCAVDEDVRTWWCAAGKEDGEFLTVDLENIQDVYAVQVNFAEGGVPAKAYPEDHTYEAAGLGRLGGEEIYEPFWFRTFRFIRLEIETSDEPITIKSFDYLETGYPLEVKTWVRTSDESMQAIWDISERSLRRCMHETYEDCPFYEQLQYAMDTRAQILYTYMTSADDRLARKCFDDFRRSQHHDGMISCSYPCSAYTIIPGFSVYYIMMLYDHMMYFGDIELIRSYLTTIDGILWYFHRHLTREGLVDKIGGYLIQDPAWSFIDWTPKWDGGVPPAIKSGPITMESLLYVMGLEYASKLASFAGRKGIADEYTERAGKVKEAIRSYCTGSNGMIQDGPGIDEYSQHCQVFAVLTGTVDLEQGKENLLKTVLNKQDYAQCTVAMAYYLFRALEKCDIYEYTGELWDIWRDMLKNNLTTCVEDPVGQRSDCHAWGALALYELPAVILGVRPTKPGFEEMEVKPVPGPFTWAEGEVITPKGLVKVQWKKAGEGIELQYQLIK